MNKTVGDQKAHLDDQVLLVIVRNHTLLRSYLAKRVGSLETAEDLLQQSLKKAIEHPPIAENEKAIKVWLYAIIKNVLIDHYRSKATDKKKNERFRQELGTNHNFDNAQSAELEQIICTCLTELLPTLKKEYAEVIKEVDLEETPLEKVAESLGVTKSNLTVRLHRARQALKNSLVQTCGACSEHGCLNCTCKSP